MMSAVEQSERSQPQCKRCGTCCRNGGPALHLEDLSLLGDGGIPLARLVTIRAGEPAFDQPNSAVRTDRGEFIKISGSDGSWSCCFWNEAESSCRIYKTRPLECRLLFCQDTQNLENVMGRDLLTRADIVRSDPVMLERLKQHGDSCDYTAVNELVADFSEDKLDRINSLVRNDLQAREELFSVYPALQPLDLFLFGRPLFLVLAPYGFRPVETANSIRMEYAGHPENTNLSVSA